MRVDLVVVFVTDDDDVDDDVPARFTSNLADTAVETLDEEDCCLGDALYLGGILNGFMAERDGGIALTEPSATGSSWVGRDESPSSMSVNKVKNATRRRRWADDTD